MPDFHFLIGKHPSHRNLNLALGGSAHGFKFMPVLGKYIVDMLEQKLDPVMAQKWKWRPGAPKPAVDPHPTPLVDLSEVPGWQKTTRTKSGSKL